MLKEQLPLELPAVRQRARGGDSVSVRDDPCAMGIHQFDGTAIGRRGVRGEAGHEDLCRMAAEILTLIPGPVDDVAGA